MQKSKFLSISAVKPLGVETYPHCDSARIVDPYSNYNIETLGSELQLDRAFGMEDCTPEFQGLYRETGYKHLPPCDPLRGTLQESR